MEFKVVDKLMEGETNLIARNKNSFFYRVIEQNFFSLCLLVKKSKGVILKLLRN